MKGICNAKFYLTKEKDFRNAVFPSERVLQQKTFFPLEKGVLLWKGGFRHRKLRFPLPKCVLEVKIKLFHNKNIYTTNYFSREYELFAVKVGCAFQNWEGTCISKGYYGDNFYC
jgi:hypothetical protein